MRLFLPFALLLGARQVAEAQLPINGLHIEAGIGVDTTIGPTREIVGLLRRYLTARTEAERDVLWSASERARWPMYDLVGPAVYTGGTRFAVLEVAPAVGLKSTYRLRVLVSTDGQMGRSQQPLILYQIYAVFERSRWVLANALPRLTRYWRSTTVGAITFTYLPGHPFSPTRAAASARFVDSLAAAFDQGQPKPITYYFTDDLGATLQALGLELYPFAPDTIGGRSNGFNRQVFVGLPGIGESYRHELAHVVLQPLITSQTAGFVMEGLMTWVGGRAGRRFGDLVPALNGYLAMHPTITLDTIVRDPPPRAGPVDPGSDGIAVLCAMVHAAGGVSALRSLLAAGRAPDAVLGAAGRILGRTRDGVAADWRAMVSRLGGNRPIQ